MNQSTAALDHADDSLMGTNSVALNLFARVWHSLVRLGPYATLQRIARSAAPPKAPRATPEAGGPAADDRARPADDHEPHACSWVDTLPGLTFEPMHITREELLAFQRATRYPKWFYRSDRRARYTLWHLLGCRLAAPQPDDVVLDVGAQAGIWGRIVRRQCGCRVIDLDAAYPPGLRGDRLGAPAQDIPLPSGSVTKIVSFCAFNCFEGRADAVFLREACRLLRAGGALVIVPLCISDTYRNLFDPRRPPSPESFDARAAPVPMPGWNTNFGRVYDRQAFCERVLDNLAGCRVTVWRVEHEPLVNWAGPTFALHAIRNG